MAATERKPRVTAADRSVRRYFDHYLSEVFPDQLERAITSHNQDVSAHHEQIKNAVGVTALKIKLWVLCLTFVVGIGSGAGGPALVKFLARAIGS